MNNCVCVRCGKEDAYTMTGRKLCYECCESNRERCRAYSQTENGKAIQRQSRKKTWAKREANGLCVRCGKRKPKPTSKMCTVCTIKQINYNRARYQANVINYPRGANGICWQCNREKAMEGHKVCEACYRKICDNNAKRDYSLHPWCMTGLFGGT